MTQPLVMHLTNSRYLQKQIFIEDIRGIFLLKNDGLAVFDKMNGTTHTHVPIEEILGCYDALASLNVEAE